MTRLALAGSFGATNDVEAYDATVFPAPRTAFLRAWIDAPGHAGCALVRDGRLAGFGVIRPCRTGYKIERQVLITQRVR